MTAPTDAGDDQASAGDDQASPGEDQASPPPGEAGRAEGGGAPGLLACGSASCATPAEACCPYLAGGTCFPANGSPPCNGVVACARAADCAPGLVCCMKHHDGCGFGAVCAATCTTDPQICASTAECLTGTCAPRSCRDANGQPLLTCTTNRCCM